MTPFQVEWRKSAEAELGRLDRQTARRIFVGVERFALSGSGDIKALKGDLADAFRLRLGKYRILFWQDSGKMIIFAVRLRSEAYR